MRDTPVFRQAHPLYYLFPVLFLFTLLFVIPTVISFFFSMTVWTLTDYRFIGLDNFRRFFIDDNLRTGLRNTVVYGSLTTALKTVLGLLLGVLLTGKIRSRGFIRTMIFFPHLVSLLVIGLTFNVLMHPTRGLFNTILGAIGLQGPDWLGNARIALFSVIAVDVWQGLGVATVIYMAGIQAISRDYYEAAEIDGASGWQRLQLITLPLVRSSTNMVIILAFTNGMRRFDFIWTMTRGGPGFATDVLSSIIYKQYAAGFYGLSTAGNVLMFLMIALISFPMYRFLTSREEAL